ncbi:MAG: sigma-54-dependent Fis family transcriptional regulator [Desulfobacterales bacterium]|nr:sigma-54-dependent Fis family transcriptional regulator [Desulfobacterales bacterium]
MDYKVLLVDDDRDFLEIMKLKLREVGFRNVRSEDNPALAGALFEKGEFFDIALIDMTMPEMDGIELLGLIKRASPRTECIMVTAVNEARVAVDCLKKGAYDYLVKPVALEDLGIALGHTLERKQLLDILDIGKGGASPRLKNKAPFTPIVTRSANVQRILMEAELHAWSDVPVLITGESGTGKELLARAVHGASPRAEHPFTPVNMASLTGSLFEAEFFGHTRGAFTGAAKERAGYLENTNRGTLFLDEIGSMPMDLQGKLLRVLQDGEYIRLGASRPRTVDVRIIAATNEKLDKQMAKGMFRKDLFYRIRGGWLHLPPLKERREDIPLLIETFLREYVNDFDASRGKVNEEAMSILMAYHYPGNIRELKSIIQSAANLARGGDITPNHLPDEPRRSIKTTPRCNGSESDFIAPLAQVEKRHILNAFSRNRDNKSKTAKVLGIGLNTLRRKLKLYGVG